MKEIDNYIQQALNMDYTDASSRSGTKAYRFEDVILIRYGNYRTQYEVEIAEHLDEAIARGAKTPRHLGIKQDGDDCWVLQEVAKGKNALLENELGEYYCNLIKAPNEQYEKLIITMQELFDFGLEIRSENIFYDVKDGFSIIDLGRAPHKKFNPNNKEDINEIISMSQGAIRTLEPYKKGKTNLITGYITYRLLNVAKNVFPNLDISDLHEFYQNFYDYSDIFEEFKRRIQQLTDISYIDLEEIANSIYEEYPKSRDLLREKR